MQRTDEVNTNDYLKHYLPDFLAFDTNEHIGIGLKDEEHIKVFSKLRQTVQQNTRTNGIS